MSLAQDLPQGAQNQPQAEDQAFQKIIEESKAKIQEAHIEQLPKRKPGRPRKNPLPTSESHGSATVAETVTLQAPTPPPDLAPMMKGPLIFISKIPATKHNIPELALSPDEAQLCAESLNQILNAFVPDVGNMDPKTAAVVSGSMVFGTVFFQKYQIYLDKKKSIDPEPLPEVQEVIADQQKNAGVDAQSYFKR